MKKVAWLVERIDRGKVEYLYMAHGCVEWTPGVNQAMKFADRASAEQICEEGEHLDLYIREHMWPDGF